MSCECKTSNPNPVNHDSCHCNTYVSSACMGVANNFHPQVDVTYYMHLISANQFLNLELKELKEERCLCANENEELQDEIEALKKKIQDLEKEIADLKDQLAKATNCDTIIKQLEAANKLNVDLAGKLDNLKTAVQNANTTDDLGKIKEEIGNKTYDSPQKYY